MVGHAEVIGTILSNFAPTPFMWKGRRVPTAEHPFQAEKAKFLKEAEKIFNAATAAEAKKLGYYCFLRDDWENIKETVMLEVLHAKYSQVERARTYLLSTGGLPIRESAPWDDYWGTGKKGNGKNRLGELLMIVRAELRGH